MTTEKRLYDALSGVMPTFHLVMDGEPNEAAIYSLSSETFEYESNIPIRRRDSYSLIVAQYNIHKPERVEEVRSALTEAGFFVRRGQQNMEAMLDAGYSLDSLTATITVDV